MLDRPLEPDPRAHARARFFFMGQRGYFWAGFGRLLARLCAAIFFFFFFFNDYLMSLMKLLLDNYEIFFPLRDALPLIEWNQREIQLEGYV